MAISTAFSSNGTSVSTTEYSLTNYSTTKATQTTSGVYQVFLDLSALTITEMYKLLMYEKVTSGTSQVVVAEWSFSGTQPQPAWVSPSIILMNGWDFTLLKVSGTDRSIGWSVRQVS